MAVETPLQLTTDDIEGVWRPLSAAEAELVPGLSKQAWIRLLDAAPALDDDLQAGTITEDAAKSAMISMIVRVLKNPESVRQLSKSYDDWSKSQTMDSSVSTGELYVNEHEFGLVTPISDVPDYNVYVMGLGG
ncbi:hypothetical protein BJH93_04120 [Kocuria polaris]|nr:hypothetical protein [Kocuria polaris]